VALPGAYTPTSIALQVIGVCRPPLYDKAVTLEENVNVCCNLEDKLFVLCLYSFSLWFLVTKQLAFYVYKYFY
jgi:hypothetical protein